MDDLRFSDRQRLVQDGSLGPLEYDVVPDRLRRALASVYQHAAREPIVGEHFDKRLRAAVSSI